MTKRQRIKNILIAILNVALAGIMMLVPDFGYMMVMIIFATGLLLYGLKQIIYYFTMARFMVSGKMVLYKGMILFDLGAFGVALSDIPKFYIMIYLMGSIIFTGVIEILRAMEKKKIGAGYKFKMSQGIVCITIGILGIIFSNGTNYVVYFYCLGMLYSALIRIIDAFRRDVEVITVAP